MKNSMQLLRRNKRLFYAVTALEYAFFNDAILILFGHDYLGLSYFQAGSLFFVGWFVSIILDFWGGVIADKVGRKKSSLLGIALQLVSYFPYLFSRSYTLLIASSVVWGVGVALSSNSLHSLIYEQASELKTRGKDSYAHISSTSQALLFISVGAATVIGGFAYKVDPRLPYGLIIITLTVAFILNWLIRVPAKVEQELIEDDIKTSITRQAIRTFRSNKPLKNFVIIGFMVGVFGDLIFAYYQPYYIELGVSAVTLGILFGALRLASVFGSLIIRRISSTVDPSHVQLINICGITITSLLLLTLKLPLVLAAPVIQGITSGLVEPNMRIFVNKHAQDNVRTSVLSFSTMIMSFGMGLGFITAYFLADHVHMSTIIWIVVTGSVITFCLRLFYSRRQKSLAV